MAMRMLFINFEEGAGLTLTLWLVESNFSINGLNKCSAKRPEAAMQSRKRTFKSCAVIPYGSLGGGVNVIG